MGIDGVQNTFLSCRFSAGLYLGAEKEMAVPGLSTMISWFAFSVVAGFLYFAPTIVAYRKHRDTRIFVLFLNMFLGWTILGWFGALAAALYSDPADRIRSRVLRRAAVRRPKAQMAQDPNLLKLRP